jgi:hypothetical protein
MDENDFTSAGEGARTFGGITNPTHNPILVISRYHSIFKSVMPPPLEALHLNGCKYLRSLI